MRFSPLSRFFLVISFVIFVVGVILGVHVGRTGDPSFWFEANFCAAVGSMGLIWTFAWPSLRAN